MGTENIQEILGDVSTQLQDGVAMSEFPEKEGRDVENEIILAIRKTYSDKVWLPIPEEQKAKDGVAADLLRDMAPAMAKIAMDIFEPLLVRAKEEGRKEGFAQNKMECEGCKIQGQEFMENAIKEAKEEEEWEEEVRSGASWTQDGGAMLIKFRSLLAQAKEEERARIKKLIEEFKDRHDGEILTDIGESANFPAPNARKTCLILLDKINE